MERLGFYSPRFNMRYGHEWLIKEAKANVVIFTGMEEHSARYDRFATYLNKAGYSVYCLDSFGQGENAEHDGKGVWPKYGFIEQVDLFYDFLKDLKKQNKPLYIFSHSMGSFMAQLFLEIHPGTGDKFVICGSGANAGALKPGLLLARMHVHKYNWNKKSHFLARMMFASLTKSVKNYKTRYDWLSYNEDNVNRYNEDPLCGYGPNNGFCLTFLEGMVAIYRKENMKRVSPKAKIFLISGKDDPVSHNGADTKWLHDNYKAHGVEDVSMKLYDHMRHEILNEDAWEDVAQDIVNFFNK